MGNGTVELAQLIVGGTAQGCVYGLIALGFVLIYKPPRW
jgi:branched-chain amino acid transport system permease protein